jgi:AcrR family transcriptional regulator
MPPLRRTKVTKRAPSRQQAKLATRDALLRAATAAFARQGLDGPSLDAICERAGFTRGAFYVHFRSREDLIAQVFAQVGSGVVAALLGPGPLAGGADRGGVDLVTTIRRFGQALASGAYPPATGVVGLHHILDACARSPLIRRRQREHLEGVRELLAGAARAGQKSGALRRDIDPEALATVLLAIVMGSEMMAALALPLDGPGCADGLVRLLDAGTSPG